MSAEVLTFLRTAGRIATPATVRRGRAARPPARRRRPRSAIVGDADGGACTANAAACHREYTLLFTVVAGISEGLLNDL